MGSRTANFELVAHDRRPAEPTGRLRIPLLGVVHFLEAQLPALGREGFDLDRTQEGAPNDQHRVGMALAGYEPDPKLPVERHRGRFHLVPDEQSCRDYRCDGAAGGDPIGNQPFDHFPSPCVTSIHRGAHPGGEVKLTRRAAGVSSVHPTSLPHRVIGERQGDHVGGSPAVVVGALQQPLRGGRIAGGGRTAVRRDHRVLDRALHGRGWLGSLLRRHGCPSKDAAKMRQGASAVSHRT